MKLVSPFRSRLGWTSLVAAALTAAVLALPALAQAPPSPPLHAQIFFRDLPPGPLPTFDLAGTSKIKVVIQVRNPSTTSSVLATQGTFGADFWRRLFVTDPQGRLGTFTGPLSHPETQVFFCHSRQGVLQRPTAIPMAPLEVIEAGRSVEWVVDDLRKFYTVNQIGRHVVQLRSPVITVVPTSPDAVIADCDQGEGKTFIDLAADTAAGRNHFTVESNKLEFYVGSPYAFTGFLSPLVNDAQCANPTVHPCQTFQKNSSAVLKFQLRDASNAFVTDATATVGAIQVSGAPPLQPPSNLGRGPRADNQYKYDLSTNQYVFTLNTGVLSKGVWRLDTTISDGSVHSVHIEVL